MLDLLPEFDLEGDVDVMWRADGSFTVRFCESYTIDATEFGVALTSLKSPRW